MIFIRFTFKDEHSETYALDTLYSINESDLTMTFIFAHKQFDFQIDSEKFFSTVFSDENYVNEYCLVELEELDDSNSASQSSFTERI